jgi:hypothetical protein
MLLIHRIFVDSIFPNFIIRIYNFCIKKRFWIFGKVIFSVLLIPIFCISIQFIKQISSVLIVIIFPTKPSSRIIQFGSLEIHFHFPIKLLILSFLKIVFWSLLFLGSFWFWVYLICYCKSFDSDQIVMILKFCLANFLLLFVSIVVLGPKCCG